MIDQSKWLAESLISGVKRGLFAREYVAVQVAKYLANGVLSAEQAEQIAVDAVYIPPVVEIGAPFDEPIIDLVTGLPIVKPVVEAEVLK